MSNAQKKSHSRTVCVGILMSLSMAATHAQGEETNDSLTVQFSGSDLLTIEKGIQEALEKEPVAGESKEPLTSPYALGTITAKGIHYSFAPQIYNTQLSDSALKFDLSIRNFRGRIERLELNESGSRACTNLSIESPRNDIPVSVIVTPKVNENGVLELVATKASFDLNKNNFKVNYPEHCSVLFGFNWLIKWTLPWVIESYKETIEGALADALAKGLRERTAELSPLLALNITLPFDYATIPAFYATVGVRPFAINVSANRIRSIFSSSITIDPDVIQPFSELSQWPEDISFVGMSWAFMNGLFREAQTKGILQVAIVTGRPGADRWLDHQLWSTIWSDFTSVVSPSEQLQLRLLGGRRYQWLRQGDSNTDALLIIEELRLSLHTESRALAELVLNAHGTFHVSSDSNGNIKAAIQSVDISNLRISDTSGELSQLPVNQDSLLQLERQIEDSLGAIPLDQRELFMIKAPSIKIGDHQIVVGEIKTTDAGLMFPLRYINPQ